MMLIIEKPNSLVARIAFTPAKPLQIDRQRVGDLVFDFLRAAAHPIGEHDHLVFAEIGNGVDRRADHGVDADGGHGQRQGDHHKRIANRIRDDAFDHSCIRCSGSNCAGLTVGGLRIAVNDGNQ